MTAPKRRPSQLWWVLFSNRVLGLCPGLPDTLRGTIQFCAGAAADTPEFFHIQLSGKRTTVHAGVARDPDTWVELAEGRLERLLFSEDDDEGADPSALTLYSYGRTELFQSLLSAMEHHQKPRSWLSIRSAP